jgi:hypothetical protein
MATLVLVFSAALFCFYCQATVQKILRRTVDQASLQVLVAANYLEFPALRNSYEGVAPQLDYALLRANLRCDFLTLTYLLKNSANLRQGYSREERLLMFYFRLVLVSLTIRHWLRLSERPSVQALTTILEYFANVVGGRRNTVCFGNVAFADYMISL